MPVLPTLRTLATTAALLLASAALAGPAAAHDGGSHSTSDKRKQFTEGVSVPVLSTPNIRWVTNVPDTAAISGVFAKSAPYFYVSSTDSITVYDVSDPVAPKITGVLPNIVFENEAMNYGEKKVDGVVNRFVLVGADLVQTSPTEPDHVGRSNEVMVVDVTDPANPRIRSWVKTTTNTHTVSCITETDCRYAYTAGRNGKFSIVDLGNLDAPREVDADPATEGTQPFSSPAGGPNPAFTSGAGHKWNFDNAGYGVHTGFDGAAVFDVSRPRHPRLVTTTGAAGRGDDPRHQGWNDFILHNSARPNAKAFEPRSAPSVAHGNVLFVTEEDYEQTDCARAGSFQTWKVRTLNGAKDAVVPLDKVELADLGSFPVPQYAFCSAHWFDYHPAGIVAVGFYGGGLQLVDARDPRHLKPFGHATWGASEVWDAYWVPVYNTSGRMTQRKTSLVYAVDLVRGLDVYNVTLPGQSRSTTAARLGTTSFATLGPGDGLSATLVAAALLGSMVLRRRARGTA